MSTRDGRDDEFAREIETHLALEAEALMNDGLDPEAARHKARATFGNVTAAREQFYERQRWPWFDQLRQDVRGAYRAIRRYPIAATVAILSLGFGIGATSITLTVRDVIFRKAPPLYRDPANISRVTFGTPGTPLGRAGARVPAPLYTAWATALSGDTAETRGSNASAIVMAAALPQIVRELRVSSGASTRTEIVPVRAVTPSLFPVLGVEPLIGRTFTADSLLNREITPAVLSHRLWQQLFDGRKDVAGQIFWIDNQPFAASGVMPERFWINDMTSPIWIPLDIHRALPEDTFDVVVRRPSGTTPAQLDAMLRPGLDAYARQLPTGQQRVLIAVSGIEGTPLGNMVSIVLPYLLAVAVVLTLLIACANVAVLMIAQWTAREHEVAIRAAIGASRGRIVRALLTESVLIAGAGGLVGIAAALVLRGIVIRTGGDVAFYDLSLDPRIFLTTALIAVLAGVAAGLAPALYETRRLQGNPLRSMAVADRVRQRWRHALVIFEITVTIALLVQTAALIDGSRRVMRADIGFVTAPLIVANVENSTGVQVSPLLESIRALPGVEAAAVSTAIPFGVRGANVRVTASAPGPSAEAVTAEQGRMTPTYFETLGVSMRAGRAFAADEPQTLRTAIVNETLARRLFGDSRRAVGATILIADQPHDVVGVVADYANHPVQAHRESPRVFTPLALPPPGAAAGVAATSGTPAGDDPSAAPTLPARVTILIRAQATAALVRTLQRELRDAAAGNVVTNVVTIDQVLAVMGQEFLAMTAPLMPLLAIGVLLTAAGIYGVLAFAVARRGRELAVRVAMGASRRDLVRLVTVHTLRLVGGGLALGLVLMFVLSRILRASGGAGSVFDPMLIAFLVPGAMIALLGVAAAWLPARRASTIDPVVLLRNS